MNPSPRDPCFRLATPRDAAVRRFGLSLAVSGLCFLGCASPGVPRPPSLYLPATVTDLAASRVGDRVELHWTTPTRTTDGLDLTTPITAELCRDLHAVSQAPPGATSGRSPRCTPVISMAAHPGPSKAIDQLPSSWTGPATPTPLIEYRVRLLNQSGRSASPSGPSLVPAGPSPAMVAGFRATQDKTGVVLEWNKTATEQSRITGTMTVEVRRTLQTILPGTSGDQPGTTLPAQATPVKKARDPFPRTAGNQQTEEVRLRQGSAFPVATTADEAGSTPLNRLEGMIDQSALQHAVYVYVAQRVSQVPLAGKSIEIRSEPTAAITIIMRDTFPPATPRGLVSIPGTVGRASVGSHLEDAIDLVWEPNTETDLAGYLVYRTDLGATPASPVRLTETPLPAPAYRDIGVLPGHRYAYRLTAIDRNGNESMPSPAVEESLGDR